MDFILEPLEDHVKSYQTPRNEYFFDGCTNRSVLVWKVRSILYSNKARTYDVEDRDTTIYQSCDLFLQEHMPYFRRRMVYEIITKKLL